MGDSGSRKAPAGGAALACTKTLSLASLPRRGRSAGTPGSAALLAPAPGAFAAKVGPTPLPPARDAGAGALRRPPRRALARAPEMVLRRSSIICASAAARARTAASAAARPRTRRSCVATRTRPFAAGAPTASLLPGSLPPAPAGCRTGRGDAMGCLNGCTPRLLSLLLLLPVRGRAVRLDTLAGTIKHPTTRTEIKKKA